jgi:membrane protein
VSNFGNYSATYGSVGTVIMLLLYFFISSAVLLFGAEVNAVIEHHAPEGKDSGDRS